MQFFLGQPSIDLPRLGLQGATANVVLQLLDKAIDILQICLHLIPRQLNPPPRLGRWGGILLRSANLLPPMACHQPCRHCSAQDAGHRQIRQRHRIGSHKAVDALNPLQVLAESRQAQPRQQPQPSGARQHHANPQLAQMPNREQILIARQTLKIYLV